MVAQVVFYMFVQNRNGNLSVPYLYENDDKVVMNWSWLDNNWNDNNPALRFVILFFSSLTGQGSFVFSRAVPLSTPEHPTYFIKPY